MVPKIRDRELAPQEISGVNVCSRTNFFAAISTITSTQSNRTHERVKPLSDRIHVPVTVLDSNQTEEVVKRIQTSLRGQTIFIAGHNNTVPAIASALSGENFSVIPGSED